MNGLYYFKESLKSFAIFVHGQGLLTLPATCFVQKDQKHLEPV